VLTSLKEADVAEVAEKLRQLGVDAVAVCLLHSFANPAHEARVAELLQDALPGVAVTASHDVLPVVREFERSMASVMNAVVMPGISRYVSRLEERLSVAGIKAHLMLMQSNGGTTGVASIRQAPVLTALSGPAAGVVGARAIAASSGHDNIITVDIGGTSADICLIRNGEIGLTQKGHVGDWPLPFPMVDMLTIGAGGGSIARVTDGSLSVGPESAGAAPGPACYGQGGALPTITDAHVVLGNLPNRLLGGRVSLDREAAIAAIQAHVAEPLEIPLTAAAQGILDITNNQMIGAIRVVSVERGHDPRDFTLVPFGGAGPLHATALAELLGIGRVLIPPAPGVLCADGLLAADLRSEFVRTLPLPGPIEEVDCGGLLKQMQREAEAWLDAENVPFGKRDLRQVASLRFAGQGGELDVAWTSDANALAQKFAALHEAQYGFRLPAPVEIVAVRVEARARTERAASITLPVAGPVNPVDHQTVSFAGGSIETAIYDRDALPEGAELIGPAIVTQLDCTTLIPQGWYACVLETGALALNRQDVRS
ncbi:MAG: hydantoinase/oxoprolinase family protein, partial [Rhizobiaceae bacterium]